MEDTTLLTLVGTALTWLGSAFYVGRKVTKVEAGLDARINIIQERQNRNIQALEKLVVIQNILNQVAEQQKTYDKTLARIDTYLLTKEGDPRFITYPAHDVISDNCRKQIVLEISQLISSQWDKHRTEVNEAVSKIARSVQNLAVEQARMSERRRSTDLTEDV